MTVQHFKRLHAACCLHASVCVWHVDHCVHVWNKEFKIRPALVRIIGCLRSLTCTMDVLFIVRVVYCVTSFFYSWMVSVADTTCLELCLNSTAHLARAHRCRPVSTYERQVSQNHPTWVIWKNGTESWSVCPSPFLSSLSISLDSSTAVQADQTLFGLICLQQALHRKHWCCME